MSELNIVSREVEEEEEERDDPSKSMETSKDLGFCRREKRKLAKKLKRKQTRKEIALKEREEEEARLSNEEEQRKLLLKEKEEAAMMERQRKEFEERERLWIERAARKAEEEAAARRKVLEQEELNRNQNENGDELDEDDDWEYVEEGPAEIIWQGNEIIVKKKRIKVAKRSGDRQSLIEDADRPTSNPLPPQSEVYASYRNTSVSSQQVFESVSQQNPNFGTEQDKAHCPFHIKTGACRFGARCSRAHFYPDKSCTLLIKNMYNGPGLAWEQDEGLEKFSSGFSWMEIQVPNLQCTDEEIDHGYEEFYEDVHTEFLKYGEIVNFKVCKNGSVHLRGNVYVHYKSLESAILAYNSINGRYFAGKQITCEYVGVTRWRVAICGEYMKSRLKTCSRGTACNFIHCFRNPGGDYEWADWDNPPPNYWVKKMVALFGPSDEVEYNEHTRQDSLPRHSKKISARHDRNSRRSRSRDSVSFSSSSGGDDSSQKRYHRSTHSYRKKHSANNRKWMNSIDERERYEGDTDGDDRNDEKNVIRDHGPGDYSNDTDRYYSHSRAKSHRHSKWRDHPDSDDHVKKKPSRDKQYKEKDKSQSKYGDLYEVQKENHSSRRKRRRENIENIDDESDGPHLHGKGTKSYDSSLESGEPCDRWETGSRYSTDEPSSHRNRSHGQDSNKRHNEVRSRTGTQNRRKEDRDVSSDNGEDQEGYHGKSRRSINEENGKCYSSGESRGISEIEQTEAGHLLKHQSNRSSDHTNERKHRRSRAEEDDSKRSAKRRKHRSSSSCSQEDRCKRSSKRENVDNDDKDEGDTKKRPKSRSSRSRYHDSRESEVC